MTRTRYKYYFLDWMYTLLDNPTEKEFCRICKITKTEIEEFLSAEYPFPVSWLRVLYDYVSTPKEFAFISFFIKKIYGETPIKKYSKSFKRYDTGFVAGNFSKSNLLT